MQQDNYEVITFANIDDVDFEGIWGGKTYIVKAKEIKMFPKFLADHFAKQLAVKICIKKAKSWDNESPDLKDLIGEILAPAKVEIGEVKIEEKPQEVEEFADIKEETFVCPTCSKEAGSKAGLMAHMRSHK
jgi:hypothetical protein